MAAVDDVDQLIEQYFRAQREFLRGNPEPVKDLFSHTEDLTLANTPMALPCVGGRRSPRPWSMPHRYAAMARLSSGTS
jgi:hypothetical protein